MRVVARVGEQGELAVQEDDGVVVFEEVLGGGGAAGAGAEVVDEAHSLVFEGDGRAAGGYEGYAAVVGCVVVDEVAGETGGLVEGGWFGVCGEVVDFWACGFAISIAVGLSLGCHLFESRWLAGSVEWSAG